MYIAFANFYDGMSQAYYDKLIFNYIMHSSVCGPKTLAGTYLDYKKFDIQFMYNILKRENVLLCKHLWPSPHL